MDAIVLHLTASPSYTHLALVSRTLKTAGLTVMRGAASLLHLKGLFYPNTKQTNRYVTYKCRYEPWGCFCRCSVRWRFNGTSCGFFFFRSTEIKNNIKTQRNTRDVSVEFLKTLFWLSMLSQLFLTPPAWKHPSTKVGKRLDQREYVRSD